MREPHLMHIERWMQIRPSDQRPDESMTSSKPTNQHEARGYELILNWWKSFSHQCVIIWRFNSTTEFVRIRLRLNGNIRTVGSALRGISWEMSDICSITPAKLNDDRHHVWSSTASPLKQRRHRWVDPDNYDQQVIILHPVNSDPSDIIRTLDRILETVNWIRAYKRSTTSIDILSSSS